MPEPIVFVSHFRIKGGKVAALRRWFEEGSKGLEAQKPRTLVFLGYLGEDGSRATIVHFFADFWQLTHQAGDLPQFLKHSSCSFDSGCLDTLACECCSCAKTLIHLAGNKSRPQHFDGTLNQRVFFNI